MEKLMIKKKKLKKNIDIIVFGLIRTILRAPNVSVLKLSGGVFSVIILAFIRFGFIWTMYEDPSKSSVIH